mmetsp:Transcript_13494/g.15697  ORF Transcript_13494/g.15697 Transcript_13494/m.15697 type:complete len:94 (+) Transcript_13494:79-360(+)
MPKMRIPRPKVGIPLPRLPRLRRRKKSSNYQGDGNFNSPGGSFAENYGQSFIGSAFEEGDPLYDKMYGSSDQQKVGSYSTPPQDYPQERRRNG